MKPREPLEQKLKLGMKSTEPLEPQEQKLLKLGIKSTEPLEPLEPLEQKQKLGFASMKCPLLLVMKV